MKIPIDKVVASPIDDPEEDEWQRAIIYGNGDVGTLRTVVYIIGRQQNDTVPMRDGWTEMSSNRYLNESWYTAGREYLADIILRPDRERPGNIIEVCSRDSTHPDAIIHYFIDADTFHKYFTVATYAPLDVRYSDIKYGLPQDRADITPYYDFYDNFNWSWDVEGVMGSIKLIDAGDDDPLIEELHPLGGDRTLAMNTSRVDRVQRMF